MIATPTKKIFLKMIDDEWILPEHCANGQINIELVLMYQHGVNIMWYNEKDFDKNRFLNVKLSDQIKIRTNAINKIHNKINQDWFDLEMLGVHNHQLKILQTLKSLLITTYN